MASQIDASKPTAGQAYTADVRQNFAAAGSEISDLQARVAALEARITPQVRVQAVSAALNNAVANGAVLRFDTVDSDTSGFAPTTSPFDHITVPAGLGGVYIFTAWSSGTGNQSTTLGMGILINGSQTVSQTNQSITGPASVTYTLDNGAVEVGRLLAGDTVQLINNSVSAGTNVFRSITMSLARIGS